MAKLDLLNDNPKKVFFNYLIPSISSTLVTSIYIFADTMAIGRGIGGLGITALNLFLPVVQIIFGFGMLFGVGGAILMSVAKGADEQEQANKYFSASLIYAIISCIAIMFIGLVFFDNSATRSYMKSVSIA